MLGLLTYARISPLDGIMHTTEAGIESPRIAVIEFPDYNAAIKCYDSPEYQEAHDILQGHVVRHHQIVEGS